MTSRPPDPAASLRRQLILAQVQLMELEDARDEVRTRLEETRRLLEHAQTAFEQLGQRHHQLASAHETLASACRELEETRRTLEARLLTATDAATAAHTRILDLEQRLATTAERATAATRRIEELAAEHAAMRRSLSWRITAPLRWFGRQFRRGGGAAT